MDCAKSKKNNHRSTHSYSHKYTGIQKELIAKATIDHRSRKVERWRRKSGNISGFLVYVAGTIDRYYHQGSRCRNDG